MKITKNTSRSFFTDPIVEAYIEDNRLVTYHSSGKTRSYTRGTKAHVTHVIDGDTVVIKFNNNLSVKVRLLGIDCPEIVVPIKNRMEINSNVRKAYCFGEQAANKTRKSLINKEVYINFDLNPIDQYKRLLLMIYKSKEHCLSQDLQLEDSEHSGAIQSFNYELVRNGYAKSSFYSDNPTYESLFNLAQDQAEKDNKGAWGYCPMPFVE